MSKSLVNAISASRWRWRGWLCCSALASLITPALAFDLITKQEAARPDNPVRARPSDGRAGPLPEPQIKVTPDNPVTTSPFNLTVELKPGTGTINLDSLQVSYQKRPPVDLKPRLERFVDKSKRVVVIRIQGAEASPGKHQILFQVEDSNEQSTIKIINLEILGDK